MGHFICKVKNIDGNINTLSKGKKVYWQSSEKKKKRK